MRTETTFRRVTIELFEMNIAMAQAALDRAPLGFYVIGLDGLMALGRLPGDPDGVWLLKPTDKGVFEFNTISGAAQLASHWNNNRSPEQALTTVKVAKQQDALRDYISLQRGLIKNLKKRKAKTNV